MKTTLISLFFLCSVTAFCQSKHALFLGNSYTYSNNLPALITNAAASVGDTFTSESSTPGGYTFQQHTTNAATLAKIQQGNFNFMILQEQSQRPSFPPAQVAQDVFPYAKFLDSAFNANNPCAETIFFMTWGRKNGDQGNCQFYPPLCTYQGMDSLLRMRYMQMTVDNEAIVSPVGAVWRQLRTTHPNIDLYSADGSHPSLAGSYAAACSFYTVMFRKSPAPITYRSTLDSATAAIIRTAAKEVVYDSLSKWQVGAHDLVVDFSYDSLGGDTYQFFGNISNANAFEWTINGSIDTNANPVHIFPDSGAFEVKLTASDGCDSLQKIDSIFINSIHVIDTTGSDTSVIDTSLIDTTTVGVVPQLPTKNELFVYPNPATDGFQVTGISNKNIAIQIRTLDGKLVARLRTDTKGFVKTDHLPAGNFIVSASENSIEYKRQIVIKH